VQKAEAKNKLIQEQMKKQQDEFRLTSSHIEGLKRSAKDSSQLCQELKTQLEKLEKELEESRQKADEKVVAAEKDATRVVKLEEENFTLKRKVEKLNAMQQRGNPEETSDSVKEEQMKLMKSKLNCSVCNDRPKSVVIARCFHCFCKECIQSNLQLRQRKCPACGKPFAESDVHSIYF